MLFFHPEYLGEDDDFQFDDFRIFFQMVWWIQPPLLEREIRMKHSGFPNIDWLGNPGKFESINFSYWKMVIFQPPESSFGVIGFRWDCEAYEPGFWPFGQGGQGFSWGWSRWWSCSLAFLRGNILVDGSETPKANHLGCIQPTYI